MKLMIVEKYRGVSMGKLKKIASALVVIVCSTACFAKQISFQIVQHDDSAKEVTESSYSVEDVLMNIFFERGYIVTNSDATVSTSSEQDETFFNTGIGEAFNGFSDYFVQVKLFYEVDEKKLNKKADLYKIDYTVASAKSGKKILTKSISEIKKAGNGQVDYSYISTELIQHINKAIKENKA